MRLWLWLMLGLLGWIGRPAPILAEPTAAEPGARLVPASPNPLYSIGDERYWLCTSRQPLRLEVLGPGVLTLLVRRNLSPGAAAAPRTTVLEVQVPGTDGAVQRFELEEGPEPDARYAEAPDLLPSFESIFGIEVPPGKTPYRITVDEGLPGGVGIGLLYLAQDARMVLDTEVLTTLEQLAGLPAEPPPGLGTQRPGASLPTSPAGTAWLLGLSGGVFVPVRGAAGLSPGVLARLGRLGQAWLLAAQCEFLHTEQQGTLPSPWGADHSARLRQSVLPFTLLGMLRGKGPWYGGFEAGTTLLLERLESLAGLPSRTSSSLWLAIGVRAGVTLALGPGRIELEGVVLGHPARIRGQASADAPLPFLAGLQLGYSWLLSPGPAAEAP